MRSNLSTPGTPRLSLAGLLGRLAIMLVGFVAFVWAGRVGYQRYLTEQRFDAAIAELQDAAAGPQRLQLKEDVLWETERQAQTRLLKKYGGVMEHRLWDDTRIDILTETEAIEIDFAHKWAEAIGQSKYYSALSGKKPAIILLYGSKEKDKDFLYRCQSICIKDGITLYTEQLLPRPPGEETQ